MTDHTDPLSDLHVRKVERLGKGVYRVVVEHVVDGDSHLFLARDKPSDLRPYLWQAHNARRYAANLRSLPHRWGPDPDPDPDYWDARLHTLGQRAGWAKTWDKSGYEVVTRPQRTTAFGTRPAERVSIHANGQGFALGDERGRYLHTPRGSEAVRWIREAVLEARPRSAESGEEQAA